MYKDPIVEEVRKIRQEHAARFGYDLWKIVEDFRKSQAESGRPVKSFPPKPPRRKAKQ